MLRVGPGKRQALGSVVYFDDVSVDEAKCMLVTLPALHRIVARVLHGR